MTPGITVFTPAYNREKTLKTLFDSLNEQTSYAFEWVIVDDASEDGTEQLIKKLASDNNKFPIKYYRQEHGGKHRAINKGVELARGEYFFIVDSDDYLLPNAIETIEKWINDCRNRSDLAGVAGLRQRTNGEIIGEYPWKIASKEGWIEAGNNQRYINKLMGDKAEVYRTSILKQYPFPEFENEFFLTESICWNRIAKEGYNIRWYPSPIYICEYNEGGLTKSGANSYAGHIKNPKGYACQVKECMEELPQYEAVTYFREYNRTRRAAKENILERAKGIDYPTMKYLSYLCFGVPVNYLSRVAVKIIRSFR